MRSLESRWLWFVFGVVSGLMVHLVIFVTWPPASVRCDENEAVDLLLNTGAYTISQPVEFSHGGGGEFCRHTKEGVVVSPETHARVTAAAERAEGRYEFDRAHGLVSP